jgi:hypothetical protein
MTYFYYNIYYYTDPCEIGPPVIQPVKINVINFSHWLIACKQSNLTKHNHKTVALEYQYSIYF